MPVIRPDGSVKEVDSADTNGLSVPKFYDLLGDDFETVRDEVAQHDGMARQEVDAFAKGTSTKLGGVVWVIVLCESVVVEKSGFLNQPASLIGVGNTQSTEGGIVDG